ncbi:Hypothetical protein R9X50_00701800 [Acrodontium crateriforme]|uniref:Hpc2-related domain-containing protein n=1 Tax=Acrodontium crateriforme TaxID=150365 RepID=A0AAQ3MBV6_9PEZI|nr:Hypothetical protein R9X50_00701800 [Acrodontium crateriforme]
MPLAFGSPGLMTAATAPDDARSTLSSSSISSPPASPQNVSDEIRVATRLTPKLPNSATSTPQPAPAVNGLVDTHASAPATPFNTSTSNYSSAANGANSDKPKRQRKKKDAVDADGKPVDDATKLPKEKKPRKPREPKDKSATAANATGPRKKQKIEATKPEPDVPVNARQPTIMEMVNSFAGPPPKPAANDTNKPNIVPRPPPVPNPSDSINKALGLPPSSKSATPRPASSGQNYDPIRGYDPVRSASMETSQTRPAHLLNPSISAHLNRASASPSIASLIDPPSIAKTSAPVNTYPAQSTLLQPHVQSQPRSPAQSKSTPVTTNLSPQQLSPPVAKSNLAPPVATLDGTMDIDMSCDAPKPPVSVKEQSKTSSPAPTPKAARPTPPPAPKGTGSGLLSSSSLFGGPSTSDTTERKGVNIDIHIPLNPKGGNTINMAQEIAKKYGRDAINPRAAAHRARLLEVAAAANKIDGGDDEMSLDDLSDMDDSNVEMGGMDDEANTATAGEDGKPKKPRKKKQEEYDKDDDFIDDTELAWQEHAAVAKDGFFVYSGPLVPVGTDAQIESSSSAPTSGRGRGRGRGRGSRGGAAGATHATVAAAAAKDPNAPPTAGRGRGRGRGGPGIPRKPRATKAEKEKAAAAAAAAAASNGPSITTTATNSTVPPSAPVASSPAPKPTSVPVSNTTPGMLNGNSTATNHSTPQATYPPPQMMGTTTA